MKAYPPDLISYNEMYAILHQKFNVTHEELRYWIKISLDIIKAKKFNDDIHETILFMEDFIDDDLFLLFPYESDLPNLKNYQFPPDGFFYPDCYFYVRQAVLQFVPSPSLRFVYQKDLTAKRNWNDYHSIGSSSLVSKTLLQANECGILRFYDTSLDEFTFHAKKEGQKWCHSFKGEEIVSSPDSFFLLYEILTLERIFFNKNRQLCLDELEIKQFPLPENVCNFRKFVTLTKNNPNER